VTLNHDDWWSDDWQIMRHHLVAARCVNTYRSWFAPLACIEDLGVNAAGCRVLHGPTPWLVYKRATMFVEHYARILGEQASTRQKRRLTALEKRCRNLHADLLALILGDGAEPSIAGWRADTWTECNAGHRLMCWALRVWEAPPRLMLSIEPAARASPALAAVLPDILRCIVPPPAVYRYVDGNRLFRCDNGPASWGPVTNDWAEANGGAAADIASEIDLHASWSDMPVLHDALLDAGCNESHLLKHCLAKCHWAGCWALRLILGRRCP
jgi:hypothetical protein